MPHIHTQLDQHDFTASAMIIRMIDNEPHALLILHKKYGKYLQPGGHVELHENPWQAIQHELFEETGYHANQLVIMQPPDAMLRIKKGGVLHPHPMTVATHPIPDNHFHTDIMYLFFTEEDARDLPGDDESQDLIWVTNTQLQNMSDEESFADMREIFEYGFTTLLHSWQSLPVSTFDSTNPTKDV